MCVSSACLCPSTICLPARSRAAACCSSLSVDVHHHCRPQWTRGRHACCFSCRFFQPALHCTALPLPARLRHCPALPGFVGSLLPRQRTHSLTTAFRPALPHPVSQSSHSQSHHDCLSVCLLRDQAATSATTSPESPARAGPDISYLLSPHLLLARSPPPVISSNLAASATVSAPSPCDAAAANNNATASDQPFACGRPIHLATSSPNERADFCSSRLVAISPVCTTLLRPSKPHFRGCDVT